MGAVDADPAAVITIDVVHRTITCDAAGVREVLFYLDDASHYSLVNGLDPIDLTLEHQPGITAHERARAVAEPWLPAGRP